MKHRYLVLTLVTTFSFFSCKSGLPEGVMNEQQMVDFLSEAYLIEGFYAIETGYHYESLSEGIIASYQELLARHGLTQTQFEESKDYYMHHPERYEVIHRQVVERLDGMNPEGDDTGNIEPSVITQKIRPIPSTKR